jgi:hypothetical protein
MIYYSEDIPEAPTVTGTFTGNTWGAILGVAQEIKLGGPFALEASLKARWATFNELTATSLSPNINSYPGPYHLVVFRNENNGGGLSSNTDYVLFTPQQLMDLHPQSYRLAVLDYSGIDADISFYFYF